MEQTNFSPLFVATSNAQTYFRLHAPVVPFVLQRGLTTNSGFNLSWPGIGILEHAPTAAGPWEVLTGLSPWRADIVPGQNEFFRVRVIGD